MPQTLIKPARLRLWRPGDDPAPAPAVVWFRVGHAPHVLTAWRVADLMHPDAAPPPEGAHLFGSVYATIHPQT